jgi:outer membrane protein TolC
MSAHFYKKPVLLGALALLGACASYAPKPLDMQAGQQRFASQRLDNTGSDSRQWDRAQLLVAAAEHNPKLRVARAQLQAASAATITAHALPNPTLSLGSEYTLSQTAESPWLWSITTDWLLDAGLRRQLRTQLADNAVRAARLDYAEALWMVRSELRAALLSYLSGEQRSQLLTNAVTDQERLLGLQRQRVTQGEAAAAEALQVELELTRARSTLVDNNRQQSAALAQLAQAAGVSISALQQQRFIWDDLIRIPALDEAALLKQRDAALLSRTDLERAVLDYQSRELQLQQAVRQQYPQVSIGPGYTWDHGVHKASLGVSLSLPIFNRNRGPIAEAEAARTIAGEQAMAVQARAVNEIDAAQQAYQSAVQVLQGVVQQSDVTTTLLQQTERALTLGAADQSTVLAARLAASAQSLAVLNAVEVMQQALGQLEDALRTPLSGPELQLNARQLLNTDAPVKP